MNGFFSRDRLIGLFCFAFAGYVWYEAGTFPTSDFDAVGLWVYGNNWYWVPDAGTPRVSISTKTQDLLSVKIAKF